RGQGRLLRRLSRDLLGREAGGREGHGGPPVPAQSPSIEPVLGRRRRAHHVYRVSRPAPAARPRGRRLRSALPGLSRPGGAFADARAPRPGLSGRQGELCHLPHAEVRGRRDAFVIHRSPDPMSGPQPRPAWDAAAYDAKHAFVWQLAADLLELLAPRAGERILDLGCGTGHLTRRIADAGAEVVGLDIDTGMIEQARRHYPGLRFERGDAADFSVAEPHDAVFSNAALHWVRDAEAAVRCI